MKNLICLLLLTIICAIDSQSSKFYVIRQWKYVNFTWPSEDTFKTAVSKGLYVPENNIIAGVKYFDDYFYLTLPRMKSGVPATLTRIKAGHSEETSPALEPFPSWEMNAIDDCNNLQSVQNIEIDTRGQIWIIDGGRIETLGHPVGKCSPKLVLFDIKSNRTTTVYNFPEEVASRNGSFLYDIVVDNTDGDYAYITDNGRDPGIIVFSLEENRSWKIRDARAMEADPTAVRFNVNGISIAAPINIAGIALGPKIHISNDKVVVNEDREVYFCPLSSLNLYSINTTILRNEYHAKTGQNYDSSIKDVGRKPSQTVGMIMDNQGILYYSLLGNNAIGRWDSHTSFQSGQRLIARDDKYIEWPNSFTFDQNGNLTVVMNRLNKFIFGKIDLNEANFRLISSHVGGRSYLYDENFNYDSGDRMTPSSSTVPVPVPSPEPEPKPDHEHDHDQPDHVHDHDQHSTTTVNNTQHAEPSSGNSFAVSSLFMVLSVVFVLA